MSDLKNDSRLSWLYEDGIRPYVFMRSENAIAHPGWRLKVDWFSQAPVMKNPLAMEEVDFADQIIRLESKAFAASGMPMPRWVFYDCAIMPGFVSGFAIHRDRATPELISLLEPAPKTLWMPLSLYIMIPTLAPREWVAHNLCSVNSLIPSEQKFYGLGFLSKAFGLWYANVERLCGMTQWGSPATRLHSHYGDFEIITAYTPVHTYANTLTYRVICDVGEWKRFFRPGENNRFQKRYTPAGFEVDPMDDVSLKSFQSKLEIGNERYFLNSAEIRSQELNAKLRVYKLQSTK